MVFLIPLGSRLTIPTLVRALDLPHHWDMAWWSAAVSVSLTSREITPRTRPSRIRPLPPPLIQPAPPWWQPKLTLQTGLLPAEVRQEQQAHRQLWRLAFPCPQRPVQARLTWAFPLYSLT